MFPLPFRCRSIQDAAEADVEVSKSQVDKDGKYEVVFPVAIPDEGTFAWVDSFIKDNKGYTEVSDRRLVDWAIRSGFPQRAMMNNPTCNDKPQCAFGIQPLDDFSARKAGRAIAPLVPRTYVVAEDKGNLIKS